MSNVKQYGSINDFLQDIKKMRAGAKVAIGYVSATKMPKTVETLDKAEGRWDDISSHIAGRPDNDAEKNFFTDVQGLKGQGRKGKFSGLGVNGIVKVQQFVTNWQTEKSFKRNSSNVEKARMNFLTDHGADGVKILKKRIGVSDDYEISTADAELYGQTMPKNEFGDNGVITEPNTGKQNIFLNAATHTNYKESFYVIDNAGDLSKPLSKEGLKLLVQKSSPSKNTFEWVLDELPDPEDAKYWYNEFCKAMKFRYQKYSMENVLYITGKIDGQKFFFINRSLSPMVSSSDKGLLINPEAFIELAEKEMARVEKEWAKYEAELDSQPDAIQDPDTEVKMEGYNRRGRYLRLTERDLHTLVKSSVYRVLNEIKSGNKRRMW